VKVLVCGSRDWTDGNAVASRLTALPGEHEEITVLQGGARGADALAATVAINLGFNVRSFPANWRPGGIYNPRAGLDRNIAMLDERPDLVIAFQINGSRGTQHTIDEARKRGIPVEVHRAGVFA
jgi:hypothetical protein